MCFKCKQQGHYANMCPLKMNPMFRNQGQYGAGMEVEGNGLEQTLKNLAQNFDQTEGTNMNPPQTWVTKT